MTGDAEFLTQFELATLPYAQWRHRTHVKVAYLYNYFSAPLSPDLGHSVTLSIRTASSGDLFQ